MSMSAMPALSHKFHCGDGCSVAAPGRTASKRSPRRAHVIVSGSLGKPDDPVNRPIALADLGGRYGFRQCWQPDGLARWYGKWVVVSP